MMWIAGNIRDQPPHLALANLFNARVELAASNPVPGELLFIRPHIGLARRAGDGCLCTPSSGKAIFGDGLQQDFSEMFNHGWKPILMSRRGHNRDGEAVAAPDYTGLVDILTTQ
jgi:hypothetical protein